MGTGERHVGGKENPTAKPKNGGGEPTDKVRGTLNRDVNCGPVPLCVGGKPWMRIQDRRCGIGVNKENSGSRMVGACWAKYLALLRIKSEINPLRSVTMGYN